MMPPKNQIEKNLVDIWKLFFKRFGTADENPYIEQLRSIPGRNAMRLVVDYADLSSAIPRMSDSDELKKHYELLSKGIVSDPDEAATTATTAAYSILLGIDKEYAELVHKEFRVSFKNTPIEKDIGEIDHTDENKIANIAGIVLEVQDPLVYTRQMAYYCGNGHENVRYADGLHIDMPQKCDMEECHSSRFTKNKKAKNTIRDSYQMIKVQRKMSGDLSMRIPRDIPVAIFGRDLIDVVNPGDYVVIDGVIKSAEVQKMRSNGIETYYLEAHFLQVKKEEFTETDPDLELKVANAVRKGHEKEDFDRLVNSISPAIKGGDYIKLNLLLMLAGSDPLWLPGKKRHRGELQMLMVGDAATAKTSHAEFIIQCFNRGIWASGLKGASSAVGLRASVVYDSQTNASRVSAGAYLMASTKYGGIVVIDEVADMSPDDYRSILEATDDRQTITIRKSQMAKEIQVNCASFHLCNPKTPGRKWDSSKNIHQNTGLDTPMLTRYDTIWVLRDVMDRENDEQIAEHTLKMHSLGLTDEEYAKKRGRFESMQEIYSPQFLQAWAQYVRRKYHPRVLEGTKPYKKIESFYLKMRESIKKYNESIDAAQQVGKITPRELGNLIRLAEASARAHHREYLEEEDADISIQLVSYSLASAGVDVNLISGGSELEHPPNSVVSVQQRKIITDTAANAEKWATRGVIIYNKILQLSERVCGACRGRRSRVERVLSMNVKEEIPCDVCKATGRVYDSFREQDLREALRKEFGDDSARLMALDVLIKAPHKRGLLMDTYNGYTKVADWEELRAFYSQFTRSSSSR